MKPLDARISKQLPPLPAPGTRVSAINRAFNAALGDSLATGATTLNPAFRGLYLNIPANIETITGPDGKVQSYVGLWPIAGFTTKPRPS